MIEVVLLSLLLGVFAVFHILLALGFPYGQASWGGRQGKVLPRNYRFASFLSGLFFVFAIFVVLSEAGFVKLFSSNFSNSILWFLTVFMGVSIFMNAFSPSKVERRWVPIISLIFILCLYMQFS